MLVLGQSPGKRITLTLPSGEEITIDTIAVQGRSVRVGITAPRNVKILRSGVADREKAPHPEDAGGARAAFRAAMVSAGVLFPSGQLETVP